MYKGLEAGGIGISVKDWKKAGVNRRLKVKKSREKVALRL